MYKVINYNVHLNIFEDKFQSRPCQGMTIVSLLENGGEKLNEGGDITMKRSICEICQNKIVLSCSFQRHYKPFQYFPSHPKPRRYSVLLLRYHQMHQQTCFPIYVPPWVSYTKESSLRVIVSNTFWRHSRFEVYIKVPAICLNVAVLTLVSRAYRKSLQLMVDVHINPLMLKTSSRYSRLNW